MAARRNDPNYIQIFGDVKKEVGLQFKATCMMQQLTLGEGLEQALELWLQSQNPQSPLPAKTRSTESHDE